VSSPDDGADRPKRVLMPAPKPTVSIGGRRYTMPRDSAEPVVGSGSLSSRNRYPQGLAALTGLSTPTLCAITFDPIDPVQLAKFWAVALDRVDDDQASDEFASISLGDPASERPHWMFVKVPERKKVKNRVHVDFTSDSRALEVKRLLSLGAMHVADIDEDGTAGPLSPIPRATSSTSPATAAINPWQSSPLGSRRADDGNHPEVNPR
jgi:hypothetical protein